MTHPSQSPAARRRRTHNLSERTYQSLLRKQDGGCAICGNKRDELQVDHDHETGLIRGLLCGPCNRGLGCFIDSVGLLKLAIEYLEENS